MLLVEIIKRIAFWRTVDRIGLDVPITHWRLYFSSTMRKLAHSKFRYFGDGAEIRPGAYVVVCSKVSLGRRVIVRPGCMFFADPRPEGAGITIEDDVMLGSGVHIYVNNHIFDDVKRPIIDQGHSPSEPVVIKRGAWIGANCVLLPGVTIGENAVVGAGSVVTRDVPAQVIAAGNPAKTLRRLGA